MGKNAFELLKFAEKFLGDGGSRFRSYCGLGAGDPWCCAFVRYIFSEGGDGKLFYNGKNVTYCPAAIQWCRANLAELPLYLAMPSDIIFFDWQPNGLPDHIGLVRERYTTDAIRTIEGNTSGGIVAYKTRTVGYIQGVFRPEFPNVKFDLTVALKIDGEFEYNSIAMMQLALKKKGYYKLKVDGIFGKGTCKALQAWAGVAQDGSWGFKTSKAIQKKLGVTVDGKFGENSVKALQKWANKTVGFTTNTSDSGSGKQEDTTGKDEPAKKPSVTLGKTEIRKTQKWLHKTKDGVLSHQTKSQAKYFPAITAVEFGEGESSTVRRLQATLSVPITGHLNEATIKAWQEFMKIKKDGVFGEKSAKEWIEFLDKPWYEKANQFAEYMTGKMTYRKWDSKDKKTQTCFICGERDLDDHHSSQCIGAAFMIWRHGGGLNCKCNYSVISGGDDSKHNEPAERLLLAKTDKEADEMASKWVGIPVKVIRNGGKALKQSQLKAGDIFMLYDHPSGKEYQHTCYYMGNGLLADNTGGRTPNFKANVKYAGRYATNCKVAIRPIV